MFGYEEGAFTGAKKVGNKGFLSKVMEGPFF
nr:sigma 54-interacting transcriptional regulator [Priestia flexa]